jgi:hypothetical protein
MDPGREIDDDAHGAKVRLPDLAEKVLKGTNVALAHIMPDLLATVKVLCTKFEEKDIMVRCHLSSAVCRQATRSATGIAHEAQGHTTHTLHRPQLLRTLMQVGDIGSGIAHFKLALESYLTQSAADWAPELHAAVKISSGQLVWTVTRGEDGEREDFQMKLTTEHASASAFWADITRIVHEYVNRLLTATTEYFPKEEVEMWDPYTPHGKKTHPAACDAPNRQRCLGQACCPSWRSSPKRPSPRRRRRRSSAR